MQDYLSIFRVYMMYLGFTPVVMQDYLCRRADKHQIPKVDNTNVDRSVATIHATVLACLRHTSQVFLLQLKLTKSCSQGMNG